MLWEHNDDYELRRQIRKEKSETKVKGARQRTGVKSGKLSREIVSPGFPKPST